MEPVALQPERPVAQRQAFCASERDEKSYQASLAGTVLQPLRLRPAAIAAPKPPRRLPGRIPGNDAHPLRGLNARIAWGIIPLAVFEVCPSLSDLFRQVVLRRPAGRGRSTVCHSTLK